MVWFSRIAHSASAFLVRHRESLPPFVGRFIANAARNPDSFAGRLAARTLGRGALIPEPTAAPDTQVRIYIAPTNYAGQGHRWAQALMHASPSIGAKNMAVEIPGSFAFETDTAVPIVVYNNSRIWQEAEFAAVSRFSHVLVEAERPLFGGLFGRDLRHEIRELMALDISVAFLGHGTDVRSPRLHLQSTPWSYFSDNPEHTALLQADADANIALLEQSGLPVFVSTPDLIIDLPRAIWCPVVVEMEKWATNRPPLSEHVPVVIHTPSAGTAKGSHLIEGPLRSLSEAGIIKYQKITNVPAVEMPSVIGAADIVLDQFRTGSYGVAACEAMATGRVVIGHVLTSVRNYVREVTGLELPVVEATPANIAEVLTELISDPERLLSLGKDGRQFAASVHSGAMSAAALLEYWINRKDH